MDSFPSSSIGEILTLISSIMIIGGSFVLLHFMQYDETKEPITMDENMVMTYRGAVMMLSMGILLAIVGIISAI